jgi:hypothetical protein
MVIDEIAKSLEFGCRPLTTMEETTIWRSEKLTESGQAAIDKCHAKVDGSRVMQAHKKISEVCKVGEAFDLVETLSFLLLGLMELQHYSPGDSRIKTLIKRAMWFTRLYDPKLEQESAHADAYRRFEQWME